VVAFVPLGVTPSSGIPYYSRQSAFSDRRFGPLKAEELPSLSISLSVLHDFEPCAQPPHRRCHYAAQCCLCCCAADGMTSAFLTGDTWSGWDIDKHGIQIDFVDSSGNRRSATCVLLRAAHIALAHALSPTRTAAAGICPVWCRSSDGPNSRRLNSLPFFISVPDSCFSASSGH
jgi:hypothetical protein